MRDKVLRLFELSDLPYSRIKVHFEDEHPTWDRRVESIAVNIHGAKIELIRFVVNGQVQTMVFLRHALDSNVASLLMHNDTAVAFSSDEDDDTDDILPTKNDLAEIDQLYRAIDGELQLLIQQEETEQRNRWLKALIDKKAVVPVVGGLDVQAVKQFVLAVSKGQHTTFAAMHKASQHTSE